MDVSKNMNIHIRSNYQYKAIENQLKIILFEEISKTLQGLPVEILVTLFVSPIVLLTIIWSILLQHFFEVNFQISSNENSLRCCHLQSAACKRTSKRNK